MIAAESKWTQRLTTSFEKHQVKERHLLTAEFKHHWLSAGLGLLIAGYPKVFRPRQALMKTSKISLLS